ncbi:MAG: AAA family ATPase [archaeon]|nr:AAA family ATPase [archaeon]
MIQNNKKQIDLNFLLILCGLPGSGKSIFAQKLREKLGATYSNIDLISIIDNDEIRFKEFGNIFSPDNENKVREISLKNIQNKLFEKNIVISDDVNYFVGMRHQIMKIAVDNNIPYFIIHISTPLTISLDWNKKRKKPIAEKIIHKIHEKFDIPGNKYKWDTPILSIDLSREDLDNSIEPLIKLIIRDFKKQKNLYDEKEIVLKNKPFSTIDELTRKFLNFYTSSFQDPTTDSKKIDPVKVEINFLIKNNINIKNAYNEIFHKYGKSFELINNLRRKFVENNKKDIEAIDKLKKDLEKFLKYLLQK